MMSEVKDTQQKTSMDYYREAWILHGSKKDEVAAEQNFRNAIDADPKNIDAHYGLGLLLKSQERNQESIQSFQKVIDLLSAEEQPDRGRAEMLRRLALANINQIKTGDWNLEGEIWKHTR